MNGQRDAIRNAVRHANEFHDEGTDRHAVARPDRDERSPLDPMLGELRFDQRERQRRAVHGPVDVREDVRHRANVILVAVRQHERGGAPFLLQVREIGNDPIHAEQLGIGKHDAGVDNDRCLAPGERQHVHPEFAESAEWNDFEHSETRPVHTSSRHSGRSGHGEGNRETRLNQAAGCA